jgi:hypothetical protein
VEIRNVLFEGQLRDALVGKTLVLEIAMEVPCSQAHPGDSRVCAQSHYDKRLVQARVADLKL